MLWRLYGVVNKHKGTAFSKRYLVIGANLCEPHTHVVYAIDVGSWLYICVCVCVVRRTRNFYLILRKWSPFANTFAAESFTWHGKSIETKTTCSLSYSTPTGTTLRRSASNIATSQSLFWSVFVQELIFKDDEKRRDDIKLCRKCPPRVSTYLLPISWRSSLYQYSLCGASHIFLSVRALGNAMAIANRLPFDPGLPHATATSHLCPFC